MEAKFSLIKYTDNFKRKKKCKDNLFNNSCSGGP